jgi:hypothetical protein
VIQVRSGPRPGTALGLLGLGALIGLVFGRTRAGRRHRPDRPDRS